MFQKIIELVFGKKPMRHINHLAVGRHVYKSIGYSDPEHPHKFVFEIHSNYGDLYKVDGCQKNVAKLIINPETGRYSLDVYDRMFVELGEMSADIKLLVHNTMENC